VVPLMVIPRETPACRNRYHLAWLQLFSSFDCRASEPARVLPPLGDAIPLPRPGMLLPSEYFVARVADIMSLHREFVRLVFVGRIIEVWRFDFEGFGCRWRDFDHFARLP
jgi:hypothetical protein